MPDKEVPVSPVNGSANSMVHAMPGHLGNLTAQQERDFSTFKENLIKANLYTRSEDHEGSHDDPTLLCAMIFARYPMHRSLIRFITAVS